MGELRRRIKEDIETQEPFYFERPCDDVLELIEEMKKELPKIPKLHDEEWQLLDLKILNFINEYDEFVKKWLK